MFMVCVCIQYYTHAGFVCVLEMEWFELTLRLCNNDQLGDEYEKVTTHTQALGTHSRPRDTLTTHSGSRVTLIP